MQKNILYKPWISSIKFDGCWNC